MLPGLGPHKVKSPFLSQTFLNRAPSTKLKLKNVVAFLISPSRERKIIPTPI